MQQSEIEQLRNELFQLVTRLAYLPPDDPDAPRIIQRCAQIRAQIDRNTRTMSARAS